MESWPSLKPVDSSVRERRLITLFIKNKNTTTLKRLYTLQLGGLVFILAFSFMQLSAQDIHYSMFYNSTQNINPALTGLFCDQCYQANMRKQWSSVPVDYLTLTGSYEQKFRFKKKDAKSFIGAGATFNYDIAGDSRLATSNLMLSGSYTRLLNKKNYLSGGLNLGVSQRAFKSGSLVFDDQFDQSKWSVNTATQEAIANTDMVYFDVGAGVNWAYADPLSRNQYYVGVAAFHLNQPETAFFNGYSPKSQLPIRLAISGSAIVPITRTLDGMLTSVAQFQGPHEEILVGLHGRYHLNSTPTRELALQIGTNWRINDAVGVPAFAVLWKQWEVGGTFDLNISDFTEATNQRGGPEFYIKYCVRPVPDKNYCKMCPKLL
jgi:type IX secretion system PorP/SprF family membrane protein